MFVGLNFFPEEHNFLANNSKLISPKSKKEKKELKEGGWIRTRERVRFLNEMRN
jgi:hypothetical protein